MNKTALMIDAIYVISQELTIELKAVGADFLQNSSFIHIECCYDKPADVLHCSAVPTMYKLSSACRREFMECPERVSEAGAPELSTLFNLKSPDVSLHDTCNFR